MLSFDEAVQLVTGKIASWIKATISLLPNIIVSVFILVIALGAAVLVGKLMRRVLQRFLKNISLVNFLAVLSRFAVLLVGVTIILNVMQLESAVISLLTGVGIIGIALGFAFQDMASNFISGIALVFKDDRPFKVGDMVETNEKLGMVEEINLRATTIRTFSGQLVFIPNRQIFQQPVINYTLSGKRRVDLAVGISYGENLEHASDVTIEAVRGVPQRDRSTKVELMYNEFGDSSINFYVYFWVKFQSQMHYLAACSEAIMRIKAAYDANGITIPFPIRTLDFGIKGGQTLGNVLESSPMNVASGKAR